MVSYTDILNNVALYGTEPLDLVVEREGEKIALNDVEFPTAVDEETGLEMGEIDFRFLGIKPSFGNLIKETGTQSLATIKIIYKSLHTLITGKYGMNAVSGPIGTVSVISEAASLGFAPVLYLFSFISINLGIMNLLPLPALDGGRIVFILIEAIRGKPIKDKVEGYVHLVGMGLLLLLMAVIAYFDIAKLIK